jgi:hypothetical protein
MPAEAERIGRTSPNPAYPFGVGERRVVQEVDLDAVDPARCVDDAGAEASDRRGVP